MIGSGGAIVKFSQWDDAVPATTTSAKPRRVVDDVDELSKMARRESPPRATFPTAQLVLFANCRKNVWVVVGRMNIMVG